MAEKQTKASSIPPKKLRIVVNSHKGGLNRQAKHGLDRFTKPALRKLALKGGAIRISMTVYEQMRNIIGGFMDKMVHDAVIMMEHGKRKTLSAEDVVQALDNMGYRYWGAS